VVNRGKVSETGVFFYELSNHWHGSEFTVFRSVVWISVNPDHTFFKIKIPPCDIFGLGDSKAAKGKESNEVRAGFGKSTAARFNFLHKLFETVNRREAQFFGLFRSSPDAF